MSRNRRMQPGPTFVLLLLCTGCSLPIGPREQTARPLSLPVSGPDAVVEAVARNVFEAVNAERRRHGLAPLEQDAALQRAAREHSEELARRGTLDHNSTDPQRRTMTMRIEAAGGTWTRAAENLANTSGAASEVPQRVVQMWLGSEGHRANMLSSAYTHTGVGIALDSRGAWYITQLYVLPRTRR